MEKFLKRIYTFRSELLMCAPGCSRPRGGLTEGAERSHAPLSTTIVLLSFFFFSFLKGGGRFFSLSSLLRGPVSRDGSRDFLPS